MSDILDFYLPLPAILSHLDPKKPLCNGGGGSPKAPPPPPPQPAPYRADASQGQQANNNAALRQGLKKTILSNIGATPNNQTLGVANNLLASAAPNPVKLQ